jgi:hypothetical protein
MMEGERREARYCLVLPGIEGGNTVKREVPAQKREMPGGADCEIEGDKGGVDEIRGREGTAGKVSRQIIAIGESML